MSTANERPNHSQSARRPFLLFRLPAPLRTAQRDGAGRHSEQGGFSLIELLVVLAIIAITGIIAGLTLLPGRSHARLLNASRDLAGDIRLARQLAVARNVDYQLITTAATGTTTIYEIRQCTSTNGACSAGCAFPPPNAPGMMRRNLNVPPPGDEGQYSQYRGVAYTGAAGSLCFAPNGAISVPGALDAACDAGFIACISLRLDANSNSSFTNAGEDEFQRILIASAGSVTVRRACKYGENPATCEQT